MADSAKCGKTLRLQRLVKRARVPLGLASAIGFLFLADPSWTSLVASLSLVGPGLAIRAYAAGTITKRKELATTGPYAYTRNPLYLGSALIVAGFAVASMRWDVALALLATFAAVYIPTILSEERYLRGRFPEFDAYAREVPRLFPRLTRRSGRAEGAGFSRRIYAKNHEYQALLGAGAVYSALAAVVVF